MYLRLIFFKKKKKKNVYKFLKGKEIQFYFQWRKIIIINKKGFKIYLFNKIKFIFNFIFPLTFYTKVVDEAIIFFYLIKGIIPLLLI